VGSRSPHALSQVADIGRSLPKDRLPAPRRYSRRQTPDSRSHSRTVTAITCSNLEVRPLSAVRPEPAGSSPPHTANESLQIHSLTLSPRVGPRMAPRRWPKVTGLTSYLAEYFFLCRAVDVVFHTACHSGISRLYLAVKPLPPPLRCNLFAPPALCFWRPSGSACPRQLHSPGLVFTVVSATPCRVTVSRLLSTIPKNRFLSS
jgi:hypothetical protein